MSAVESVAYERPSGSYPEPFTVGKVAGMALKARLAYLKLPIAPFFTMFEAAATGEIGEPVGTCGERYWCDILGVPIVCYRRECTGLCQESAGTATGTFRVIDAEAQVAGSGFDIKTRGSEWWRAAESVASCTSSKLALLPSVLGSRRLDALGSIALHEAEDAKAGAEALLGMRLRFHDRLEQCDRCGADLLGLARHACR